MPLAPAIARADLEHLLRAKKLDVTLTSAAPLADREGRATAASGLAALDERLGGGVPRGQLSEITGPRSSGRTWVASAALAATTGRGELAALVDTFDTFDPASVPGLACPRLLWVRGVPLSACRTAARPADREVPDLLTRVVDRAIKAAALVLQAGGFGLVVLDLADAPPAALRRLPFTTWLRLQRVIEGHDTAGLVVSDEPLARSAGGVSIRMLPPGTPAGHWQGTSEGGRRLAGVEARVRVARARWHGHDDDPLSLARPA